MPNHMKNHIWLIGAGAMAIDYAKVLDSMNLEYEVIGRGIKSSQTFMERTGVKPYIGGLKEWLNQRRKLPTAAIVAVSIEQLKEVTLELIKYGIKRILVEKPGGLTLDEIYIINMEADKSNTMIFVGYNRRFYSSVLKAEEIIKQDGGVKSFNFEFSEWSHVVEKIDVAQEVKRNWFLANSSHVVDMAFFLGGYPLNITCYSAGGLGWHPSASIFVGAGITKQGALFSYSANWEAPGRWGVEVLTNKHRLFFRPLEKLQKQKKGTMQIETVILNDDLDIKYKPGLYRQVSAFINYDKQEIENKRLVTIQDQYNFTKDIYTKINGFGTRNWT